MKVAEPGFHDPYKTGSCPKGNETIALGVIFSTEIYRSLSEQVTQGQSLSDEWRGYGKHTVVRHPESFHRMTF